MHKFKTQLDIDWNRLLLMLLLRTLYCAPTTTRSDKRKLQLHTLLHNCLHRFSDDGIQ